MLWAEENAAPEISTPTIRAIAFQGNIAIDSKTLEKRLSIKTGGPYSPQQVAFSRDVLESVYRDKGYADVHVSTHTAVAAPHAYAIIFHILEGPVYHVHAITIEGNKAISKALILRDLGIKPGDTFSQSKIYDGNKQMFMSGYFETADIHYSSAPANEMDVHVKVKERPTKYVKGGFGYGTETKERVSLGYEDRNFFGNEKQFDVTAVHSGFLTDPDKYRTTILETSLAQPHIFDSKYEGQTSVSEEWDDRQAYDSRTTAWRSSVGRRFTKDITASLRYRYQGTELTRIDPSAAFTTLPFTNVSAIGPTFTYDNTNDPFLPTVGWRVTSLLEKGFTLGIGDINFTRFEARAGRFNTVFGQWTTFVGLQGVIVRPDNPNDSIPIFERYTFGGANTIRGYEEQELGPRDAQGNPLGGNAFGVLNLEMRHPIYKKLWGVWFLDGGQLYQQPLGNEWPYIHAKGLNDFAFGTGPGLRLNTPVGAVRLEVGYKLNPPGNTPDFFQRTTIHFSLGEVF